MKRSDICLGFAVIFGLITAGCMFPIQDKMSRYQSFVPSFEQIYDWYPELRIVMVVSSITFALSIGLFIMSIILFYIDIGEENE